MTVSIPSVASKGLRRSISVDRALLISVSVSFLVTRILVGLVIFLSSATMPIQPGRFLFADPNNVLVDGLVRFDSWWYLDIVRHGYRVSDAAAGQQGTVAFFPLYPLTIRALNYVIPNDYIAGLLISNVAFLVALVFLYLWADREFEEGVAGRVVFYLAAAPAAVVFSALYTESLFLALVCATFFFVGKRQWYAAAIPAILASATRNTGVFLAAVIAFEGLRQAGVQLAPRTHGAGEVLAHYRRQFRLIPRSLTALSAAATVPLGIVAYMFYLTRRFDDPLAFVHAQTGWGRSTSAGGILSIASNTRRSFNLGPHLWWGQVDALTFLNCFAALAFLALIVAASFKLKPGYVIFAALSLLAPLSSGSVGSMIRYVVTLVPCFALLAIWGRRQWVDRLVLGVSLPLMALLAVMFSHWYFAG